MTTALAPATGTARLERRAPVLKLGVPFILLHLSLIDLWFVGVSWTAVSVACLSYLLRTFGITAFYHRCLSHRSFKVPRAVQFVGALLGASAAQRGPLWWVAHHRMHHRHADRQGDPHSPVTDGFWYSHVLWVFQPKNAATDLSRVADLACYRELRALDRYEHLAPVGLAAALFTLGEVLSHAEPQLHTTGLQLVMWGFVLPTVVLYHATFAVNSLTHRFGRRRFDTPDESRNNWFVALLVLGEGWHNNHHKFPNCARSGIGRFEFDPTWLGIRCLRVLGLASNLRELPAAASPGRIPPRSTLVRR